MKNEKRYAKALVRKVKNNEGILSAVIGSTATVDRYGESIDQSTWQLENFMKNPVILWAHNLTMGEDRPPIAKALDVIVRGGKLLFDIQFDMADPFAADIFRKYQEGFLNAFSVGFISHRIEISDSNRDVPVLMDNELLELSAVPVPANPEALQALHMRSFATRGFKSMLDEVEKKDIAEKKKIDDAAKAKADKKASKKKDIVPDTKIEEGTAVTRTADPVSPSVGRHEKLVAVVREATRQLQLLLAEENAAIRAARDTQKKGL